MTVRTQAEREATSVEIVYCLLQLVGTVVLAALLVGACWLLGVRGPVAGALGEAWLVAVFLASSLRLVHGLRSG